MNMDAAYVKRELRKIFIRDRQDLSTATRRKWSRAIVKHVLKNPVLKKSKVVAAYIGFGSEVETYPLIEKLWELKKTVVVPITKLGLAKTYFAVFRPEDALAPTRFGPLEPARKKKPFNLRDIDLVLVPGLAYDRRGYRLGYGGGVYDRILKKTPRASHVGLFFSSQEVAAVPVEKFDRKMRAILTENGVAAVD